MFSPHKRMFAVLILSYLAIAHSQQIFREENTEETLLLFSNFLRDFTTYCNSSGVNFIVENTTDEYMDNIRFITKNRVDLALTGIHKYTNADDLIKDFDRHSNQPRLVVIFSTFDDFIISIIDQMKNENRITNYISWLIVKPINVKPYRRLVLPPSFRLFTIMFSKIKKVSMIKLGFFYTDYRHKHLLVSHKYNGVFTKNRGLQVRKPFKKCCYDLRGYRINIVYIKDDEPCVIVRKTGPNSWLLSGIFGDILTVIFDHLGVRYNKVYPEPNDIYGGLDENNETIGLFKELHEKNADIALGAITETPDRRKISDISIGMFEDSIGAIFKEQSAVESFGSFYYRSFSSSSWFLIAFFSAAMLIISSASLKVLRTFVFGKTLLDLWGAELGQGTYEEPSSRSVSRTCYYTIVLLLGMLLSVFYNSKLVANKSVTLKQDRFNSLTEIAKDNQYFPVVIRYSALYQMLKQSTDEEFVNLWNRIKTDIQKHTSINIQTLRKRRKDDFAVLITSSIDVEYMKFKDKDCVIMNRQYLKSPFIFAFQKYSPLTRIINDLIQEMLENGIIDQCLNRYKLIGDAKQESKDPEEVGLFEFSPLMLFLLLSGALVLIILALEIICFNFF